MFIQDGEVLVIDLFSGPGGLGEGFAAYKNTNQEHLFKIGISVEKDPAAHKTLTTRAFFRACKNSKAALRDYYRYARQTITREQLFALHPEQASQACEETLGAPHELGKDNNVIHKRIRKLCKDHQGPQAIDWRPTMPSLFFGW